MSVIINACPNPTNKMGLANKAPNIKPSLKLSDVIGSLDVTNISIIIIIVIALAKKTFIRDE